MSKNRGNVPKPGVSCAVCHDPDDSRMVCCDDCGKWFHFKCVGVDEGIEEVDWSCTSCEAKRAAQVSPTLLTVPVQVGVTKSSKGSQQERMLLAEFQEQMDQMQRRFEEQQLAYQMIMEEKDREMQNALKDLQRQYQHRMEKREQQIREELNAPPAVIPPSANSTALGGENRAATSAATDVCEAMERMQKQLEQMAKKQELETKRLESRLRAIPGRG